MNWYIECNKNISAFLKAVYKLSHQKKLVQNPTVKYLSKIEFAYAHSWFLKIYSTNFDTLKTAVQKIWCSLHNFFFDAFREKNSFTTDINIVFYENFDDEF